MNITKKETERGFKIIEFRDIYDQRCSIQKSSLATENAIWVGITEPEPIIMGRKINDSLTGWVKYPLHEDVHISTRMHLSVHQAKEVIKILQKFVDTGDL